MAAIVNHTDDTEIRYTAEYKYFGDDDWYVAGNIYGYPTKAEAAQAIEDMRDKWKTNSAYKPLEGGRITTIVTTATTRPYILI